MTGKTVPPTLAGKSFTCPHCNAISHQTWYSVHLDTYNKDQGPFFPDVGFIREVESDPKHQKLAEFLKRLAARELFHEKRAEGTYINHPLANLYVSLCYSCEAYAVWVADELIYPDQVASIQPTDEMPPEIRRDFMEAASIVDDSARGAAALLRLCVQKLMIHLELKGKNIDEDISDLVSKGLDLRIQKALDVLRVIGNNAVHPGQIDLRDDKATALKLFNLVNLVVEAMIASPKHIEEMYGALPEKALKAIEKRDGKDKT